MSLLLPLNKCGFRAIDDHLLHTHTLALIRSYTVYVKTYSCAIKGVLMVEGLFHLRKIMVRHCFYLDFL